MSKPWQRQINKGESRSRYRLCVPPCLHYIKRAGIHTVCAWSDWKRSMQRRLPALWVASTAYASFPESFLWGGSFHQRFSRCRLHFRQGGAVCKPGGSMSGPPPPLERTKGPPENQQKLSLAYITAASETQHTVQFTPCTYGLIIFPCSPFSSPLSSSPRIHWKPMQCNACTKK